MTQEQQQDSPQDQDTSNEDEQLLDTAPTGDPLEDLFQDAMLQQAAKNPKQRRQADPSLRNSIDAAAKRMRELYTLPENWTRTRGIALIDKATQTLVGNFSEYVHNTLPGTRKLLREHTPLAIDATEVVEGYLGEALEQRLRGRSWTEKHSLAADLWFDELMVGAPKIKVTVCLYLGAVVRVDLEEHTQFASQSGATIMHLPQGTDVYACLSTDTKGWIRKQVTRG